VSAKAKPSKKLPPTYAKPCKPASLFVQPKECPLWLKLAKSNSKLHELEPARFIGAGAGAANPKSKIKN
jgi:hypothetical protein